MRRVQRGQAIVLIALMFGVLCGMVGLAIDGGRAYVDHRQIQNSADASAAAGAATYIRKQSFDQAEQAMVNTYALNRGLTPASPACSPAVGTAPASGGTVTLSCSFSNDSSQSLTITVQDHAPPASFEEFTATGNHSLLTALIQVTGSANNLPISATGCAATWDSGTCAAVPPVVLGMSTLCGSGGDSVKLIGGGSGTAVVGNVGSFGDVDTGGGTPNIAGDTTFSCGTSPGVTPKCYPGGSLYSTCYPTSTFHTGRPPVYNIPTATTPGSSQSWSGLQVNLGSGVYGGLGAGGGGIVAGGSAGAGSIASPCVFLGPGVYSFPNGLKVAGGIFSNELRPPDEPDQAADPTGHGTVSSHQFWNQNASTCAGAFSVTAVADAPPSAPGVLPLPTGSYAFRITSVRPSDNGVARESGPSACRTLNVALAGQGASISVSNVPGAQDYNVYLSSTVLSVAAGDGDLFAGTCKGKFYPLSSIPVQNYVNETNANTNGCPSTATSVNCTLGVTAQVTDLCAIDQVEYKLGVLGSVPATCQTVLPPPAIPPQPALTCTASAYVVVPPPPGTLGNPPVAGACVFGNGPVTFRELLAPAGGSLPDQDPAVGYETANWGACDTYPGLKQMPFCPNNYNSSTGTLGYDRSAVLTPGAVQLQAGVGGCFGFADTAPSSSRGLPFLFSGYQYSWGLLMHSDVPTCSDQLAPATGGQFVGHYYGPSASVTVAGTTGFAPVYGPQAPTVYGCVIASRPTVDGSNGLAVYFVTPTQSIQITGYGVPVGSGC